MSPIFRMKGMNGMNNQNPYQPQLEKQPEQPGQQPVQQPMPQQMQQPLQQPMPQVMYQPYVPQQPKSKFFDREMVSILGCTCSAIGLCMAIVSAIVGGNATYIYGLIMVIVSAVFSAGGFVISLVVGNKNVKEGKARGTFASWGLVLGLTGLVLFVFLIFFSGCMTCYYNKRGGIQW